MPQPPSLVKRNWRARGVATGASSSTPMRLQVPLLMNALLLVEVGDGGDGAGGIVRGDGDDGEGLAEAAEVEEIAANIGEHGGGRDDGRQNAIWNGEGAEQIAVPVARGVVVPFRRWRPR